LALVGAVVFGLPTVLQPVLAPSWGAGPSQIAALLALNLAAGALGASLARVPGWIAAMALGMTTAQSYRYVLLPNAYRVIVPPMTSEMMNLVKNSAIASTIGLVDMAAQAGKLLDYSAHAWESFTAITLAYVLINAVIMLVMTLVERKVRLPGNMGGK
jgi:ABC-type amino acid transport system permease subunit